MKKLLKTAALTGGILFAVKGLDNRIEVTHYDISSPKIPEGFDGYKILQISDYHADSVPGLIEEIEHESPDIIVSTGDLVHDTGSYTPGVGDPLYGIKKEKFNLNGQLLHAKTIGFVHPRTGKMMEFTSDIPEYFENVLEKLRKR